MLYKNQVAPEFVAQSINGDNIDLQEFRGKKVLLKFHRFSGCPVARSQIKDFMKHQKELHEAGVETIVFLHNSRDKVTSILHELPGLHIVADKQRKIYKLFQSEFKINQLLSLTSWMATFKALFRGYFPLFNRFQVSIVGIPSDFLIDENGIISELQYGKHFGDSWTASKVLDKSARLPLIKKVAVG
jgi:peroxiredoxin